MVRRFHAVLLLALLSGNLGARDIYKCKGADGTTTYSDSPCGADAKAIAIPKHDAPARGETIWCNEGGASRSLIDQCVDLWRPSLRDPRSAYADSGTLVHPKEKPASHHVFVDGHAKNGFGGMNSYAMRCEVGTDGASIDAEGTQFWLGLASIAEPSKMPSPRIAECGVDKAK